LNVVEKLPKLLQANNFEVEKATLALLFNLSFDAKLRDKMIRVGFLQKLVTLLGNILIIHNIDVILLFFKIKVINYIFYWFQVMKDMFVWY
jgi:hypothetical protein